MSQELLAGTELEDLLNADLTYAEVGYTQREMPTGGYRHTSRSAVVGSGPADFDNASQTVMSWEMHRRSGLPVRPSSPSAVEGSVAVLRLGFGALAVHAPVRVICVVKETHRRGFAYGTLPGHPESGEEAFAVEPHNGGEVTLTITAFSRPASLLARAGGPVSRAIQSWVTNRYLRSVQG